MPAGECSSATDASSFRRRSFAANVRSRANARPCANGTSNPTKDAMTDPSPHAIPRWKSLGPVTVFTAGPWEAIGFVWLLGLTALAIWLATPVLRVGAVVDPILAALVGAAL